MSIKKSYTHIFTATLFVRAPLGLMGYGQQQVNRQIVFYPHDGIHHSNRKKQTLNNYDQ